MHSSHIQETKVAKILLCDVCLTRHDKLTRATKYLHVKGYRSLRIDLCNVHMFEMNKKFPKVTIEYVQFVYKMAHGTELPVENAERILKDRR